MDKNVSLLCTRGLTTVILLIMLSACGGGAATTSSVTLPPTPTAASFAQMATMDSALLAEYTPVIYTDLGIIPVSGDASYAGIFKGDLANVADNVTDTVIGEMELAVSFTPSSASVSGSVTNFYDDDGAAMAGNLIFTDGRLDRGGDTSSDATFTLSADGSLTDANNQVLVFDTTLEGDFLGNNYDAVGGNALGRITHNGTSQNFDGTFIAER